MTTTMELKTLRKFRAQKLNAQFGDYVTSTTQDLDGIRIEAM